MARRSLSVVFIAVLLFAGIGAAFVMFIRPWQGGDCNQARYPNLRHAVDRYVSDVADASPVQQQQADFDCQENHVRAFVKLDSSGEDSTKLEEALINSGWKRVDGPTPTFTRPIESREARAIIVPDEGNVHLSVYVELD